MRYGARFWVPAVLFAALPLASCSDSATQNNPGGQPRVTVRLTDAAGDIVAAVVTISEINLQGSDGKVVLMSSPVTTDLVDLANNTATLVDAVAVPAGTYTQLRFVITGGYVEVENADGTTSIYASSPTYSGLPAGAVVTGDLQMPSLAQSGLKVDFPSTELEIDEDQDFLVDFNVSESFGKQAGNSGKWVMRPVIKGAVFTTAATVVATLKLNTGVTLPVPPSGAVTLAAFKANLNGEVINFSDPDGDGVFEARFRFLLPGTYALSVQVPAGLGITTNLTLPVNVTVDAGETETVAVVIQTAVLVP
ncbi:MAG TPA: DUF4382 domain-containing protein [Gemmatimonadales bacterium]|jgi:hypothetical protein|nr:DUF4382 domain-containing protein [Gemmatimonadales bacterium]HEV8598592.1 DUF4382 domain-containing protein [Gemmatimonadales bacterium]